MKNETITFIFYYRITIIFIYRYSFNALILNISPAFDVIFISPWFSLLNYLAIKSLRDQLENFSGESFAGNVSRRGCEYRRPPRLTLVFTSVRFCALPATECRWVQIAFGVLPSVRDTLGLFLRCEKENTRRIRARRKIQRSAIHALRKRKFTKFTHALRIKCCALRNPWKALYR